MSGPIYPTYDIFSANRDGTDIKRLTTSNGYDAEGTVSTDGKKIVFTSTRNGDLDLYEMNIDGTRHAPADQRSSAMTAAPGIRRTGSGSSGAPTGRARRRSSSATRACWAGTS